MKQIIAVGGDPGGAAALAPVLRELWTGQRQRLRIFGYRQAVDVWARSGIPVERLPETGIIDPAAWIGPAGADLILTATSINGVDHEREFYRWAASASVPSVAVLDFWTNYVVRFRNPEGTGLLLPSVIAVIDERARYEMISLGFPAKQIVVTGQPAFDALGAFRTQWNEVQRRDVRAQFGATPGCHLVLFLSQPLSAEMSAFGCNLEAPIDEREMLGTVASALEGIASAENLQILLAVRPHPREQLRIKDLPRGRRVKAVLADKGDPWPAVLAADLVVGMTTALLVEACLLGCVVVSVQPGAEGRDPVPTNRAGQSIAVYDLAKLPGILHSYLLDKKRRNQLQEACAGTIPVGATARVLELIERILDSGGDEK